MKQAWKAAPAHEQVPAEHELAAQRGRGAGAATRVRRSARGRRARPPRVWATALATAEPARPSPTG